MTSAPTTLFQAEVTRVRAHLARALRDLHGAEARGLTPAQRRRRARHVSELARYRLRGRFPRNRDFPGALVPYFVDADGTRCAVAHLIEADGGGALVHRVAGSANHARVAELASDPAFLAWLEHAGLTVEEAAKIQPAYCQGPASRCVCLLDFAPTLVEGQVTTDGALIVVSAVHGVTDGVMPGDQVPIANPGIAFPDQLAIAGFSDGTADVYFPLVDTSTLDTQSCFIRPSVFAPPTLSKQVFLDIALGAARCESTLVSEDPGWAAKDTSGCGNATATSTSATGAQVGAATSGAGGGADETGEGGGVLAGNDDGGCATTPSSHLTSATSVLLAAALCTRCAVRIGRKRR